MKWLISIFGGLIAMALLGGVVALAKLAPGVALTSLLVAMFAVPIAWVFVSALYPVVEDRNCPACGEWALEPLDPLRAVQG